MLMIKILNFHEVYNYQWLDNLMVYLKSKYEMVSMDTLNGFYKGDIQLKNACHITVDDGEKSFYEVIFPVLKKHNIPASLFISPKMITERSNYWFQEINGYNPIELGKSIAAELAISYGSLNKFHPIWILKTLKIIDIFEVIKRYQSITNTDQKKCQNITIENLKEVHKSGLINIGAHTMNHPILKNEDYESSNYEIRQSIINISNILNCPVKYFAYPNGNPDLDFSDREEKFLMNNGIQLAVSLEQRNIKLTDNRMLVPRFGITDCQSLSIIKSKLILGNFWNNLRKIKYSEEVKQRNQFRNL
jgi:peptidoglycan/xylan/chitin deacetylase (PgdA/CDA1 family)